MPPLSHLTIIPVERLRQRQRVVTVQRHIPDAETQTRLPVQLIRAHPRATLARGIQPLHKLSDHSPSYSAIRKPPDVAGTAACGCPNAPNALNNASNSADFPANEANAD
jgi:hypothetical protein